MNKGILISALDSAKWIGGLYYKKNIAFVITQNKEIMLKYSLYVITHNKYKDIFTDFHEDVTVISFKSERAIVTKVFKMLLYVLKNIRIEYPLYRKNSIKKIDDIMWIADFQDKYYPQFFSDAELRGRESAIKDCIYRGTSIVVSSENAKSDFLKFYGYYKNIYVVPFVSFIEFEIRHLTKNKQNEVLKSNDLLGRDYAVIMNQFWQHKNHIVVFQAIKYYLEIFPNSNFYRNPDYIERLKTLTLDSAVASHISILGFIDRAEQIAIMKNASFVIQPSLFEGWGTVVEDAKVLDKTILLSDIPVHREQMNEKCILFNPHDPVALAELIEQESQKEHYDDVEKGIADMYKRAKEYSKGFEQLLRDLEKK